jgi:uncharacterized protein (DUF1800 family)
MEAIAAADNPMNASASAKLPPQVPRAIATAANAGQQQDYERFNSIMAQAAIAYRVQACTNPELENPMLAKLTEFWFNHFNVFIQKAQVRPFIGHYMLEAIRPNVLGKFEDMVLATAKHPAMLGYLDQNQSVAEVRDNGLMRALGVNGGGRRTGLNENYARELMELHTLGVNGGYTQQDVRELARVLTGWSVGFAVNEPFRFYPARHDKEPKTVLGRTFINEGVKEGEDAIRMLARHPATAQRIALRMAQWFVADTPPPALVQRLASTFSSTQGDLMAVTRALIESPEFWDANNTLVKTPVDYACSAVAMSGGIKTQREAVGLVQFLEGSGQGFYRWQTPDGYKVDAATWLVPEALTRRADFAMQLSQARGAQTAEWAPLVARYTSAKTRERVAQEPEAQRLGLMLASPEFMRK